ncbi:MAG TPA: hypothetical protein DEF51_54255 [Myxococcales bacterium]|nr:hypothetical protein [Myxococcales bacterium]
MTQHANLTNPFVRVDARVVLYEHPTGWSPDTYARYEEATRRVLNRSFSTRTGQLVRDAIRRPVTIAPWPDPSVCNADANALVRRDALRRGAQAYYCADIPATPIVETGTPDPHAQTGTGRGSDAVVRFTPRQWETGICTIFGNSPGGRSDEVLLHELFHALRVTVALRDCSALVGGYDTFGEFAAIAVTNMHSRELGRPLRRNHGGFTHVIGAERTYNTTEHAAWTLRLCRQMPELTRRLSRIPLSVCDFNPFLTVY